MTGRASGPMHPERRAGGVARSLPPEQSTAAAAPPHGGPRGRASIVEELTQVHLRAAEVLAIQIAAGRLSSARTEQLAHVALARAARDYDPAAGDDFLSVCMPAVRRDLQRVMAGHHALPETGPQVSGRVDVVAEGDVIRVSGLTVEDLVRRLKRGHHGETLVAIHTEALPVGGDPVGYPPHDLSEREEEIVRRIAAGLSNRDLAASLFLGLNTVKTYIRTAYRKMGVTSRSQAVMWAVRHGLGPDGEPAAEQTGAGTPHE